MNHTKKYAKTLKARELRKESTEAEKKLWKYLRDRRFFKNKFRRQHVLSGFIVDFYCPTEKLAIELDGPVHLKQKDYDSLRQDVIENSDVKVLRFKNRDVLLNIKMVLRSIKNHIPRPSPSKMEKGGRHQPLAQDSPG